MSALTTGRLASPTILMVLMELSLPRISAGECSPLMSRRPTFLKFSELTRIIRILTVMDCGMALSLTEELTQMIPVHLTGWKQFLLSSKGSPKYSKILNFSMVMREDRILMVMDCRISWRQTRAHTLTYMTQVPTQRIQTRTVMDYWMV